MARAVVLGGGGGIGRIVVRALTTAEDIDEIHVADISGPAAQATVDGIGSPKNAAVVVDAGDPDSIRRVVAGADVVVSCIGPFYRFGAPVLSAVIEERINFVDVCDDLDATLAELELDRAARDAGVTALIGMGNSPGLANVLVRYAADYLLDTVTRVDIMHIHGGEPDEGGAVVRHRIHAMVNDVPLFIDGAMIDVRMLEPSGAAFTEETDFRDVGVFPVYPYPHPETITLPRHLPGVQRVTNRGVVFPLTYFDWTRDCVARALGSGPSGQRALDTEAVSRVVDEVLAERTRLLDQAGVTGPSGCLKIEVEGIKDNENNTFVFSISSKTGGAGEGTGIPAALGALMLLRGAINEPGVHPPEAVVDPVQILNLAGEVIRHFGFSGDGAGGSAVPIHIEHITADGKSSEMKLEL